MVPQPDAKHRDRVLRPSLLYTWHKSQIITPCNTQCMMSRTSGVHLPLKAPVQTVQLSALCIKPRLLLCFQVLPLLTELVLLCPLLCQILPQTSSRFLCLCMLCLQGLQNSLPVVEGLLQLLYLSVAAALRLPQLLLQLMYSLMLSCR